MDPKKPNPDATTDEGPQGNSDEAKKSGPTGSNPGMPSGNAAPQTSPDVGVGSNPGMPSGNAS